MIDEAAVVFPKSADTVVATLAELFWHQGNRLACEVLDNARARIEETGYDNWDGGTNLFTLFLDLPLKVFAPIEPEVSRLEKLIAGKLTTVLRNTGNMWLREVTISPVLEQPSKALDPRVAPVDVEHLWQPGMFRLFLSHVSAHKVAVSKLKWELRKFGISSFVAHEDIEPTLEWQREIELALRSMHALVALFTPDFHTSNWTDQEVGFALGKGVLVIPVRLGFDPYGFLGKIQGASGNLDASDSLASGVVDLLFKNHTTAGTMREALIVGLEKSSSFAASKAIAGKLEALKHFTTEQLARMEAAIQSNDQVTNSFGVRERIQRIILRFKPPVAKGDDVPF